MADDPVPADPKEPASLDGWSKALAAVLPLLQLGLTGLGLANGGLQIAALNHPLAVGVGAVVVVVGVVLLLIGTLGPLRKALTVVGTAFIAVGIVGTGYTAIALPQKASSPTVAVTIASTDPLVLRTAVTASGIKRGEAFQIEVNGYIESGHRYVRTSPLLYHAVLGANSTGEITSTAEIPIKAKFDAVAVDAWSGTGRGPGACGFDASHPGTLGYPIDQIPHFGCAVLQISPRGRRIGRAGALSGGMLEVAPSGGIQGEG
jgi:hypothetical protein